MASGMSSATHRYVGQDAEGIGRCVCGSEVDRFEKGHHRRICVDSTIDVSDTFLRRVGAVHEVRASGQVRVWVNGLTEGEGVVITRPAGMPDDIAVAERTFDVIGVAAASDLGHGIYTRQPADPTLEDEREDDPSTQSAPLSDTVPSIQMNGTEFCGRCGAEPRDDDDGWSHCDCCPDDCADHAPPLRWLAR